MDPMTAYAIYQGGKLIVNTIMGNEKKKAQERAANTLEDAAARTVSGVTNVGKSLYANLDIIGDKIEQGSDKLMHQVGSKIEDVYDKFRDMPASFANNFQRTGMREKAGDDLWNIFKQGTEELRLKEGDMKVKAFTEMFGKVASIERRAGSMMSKVRSLRGK
tara:strand:+ start:201 stop:686 length:486 start_codon:yes stop_codon:yes gene_type:complete